MAINVSHLTEQQVLNKLDIPDFRHLSKEKIMTFFSMLSNMDPEVAKKAIEQFPAYADAVKEVVSEYMAFFSKALNDNTESVRAYYSICDTILAQLSKMLEQDELSFEEKSYIIEKMVEIESRVYEKDTENKKHRLQIYAFVAAGFTIVIAGLAAVLGVNSGFSVPTLKTDYFNENDKR